jgi:hypothetical protein
LAPRNPLPFRCQLKALRSFIDGFQKLADAGGPVSRIVLGPKRLFPTAVVITSPQEARDVLGRTDEIADRGGTPGMVQMQRLMGGNLLNLSHGRNRWHYLPFTVAAAAPIRARVHARTQAPLTK